MAKIDKMLEMMSARGVERAVLVSDRTIELHSREGTIDGPHLSNAQLREALTEIIPPSFFSAFENGTSFQFVHQAPSGTFNILIQNYLSSLQATVTPLRTDNAPAPVANFQAPTPPPVAPSPWNAAPPANQQPYTPPAPQLPTSPYSQSAPQPVAPMQPPPTIAPYQQTPVNPPPYGTPAPPYSQQASHYPPPLPPPPAYSQPGPAYAPPPPNYPQSGYPNPSYPPNQGYPNPGHPNQSYPVQGYGVPVIKSHRSKTTAGILGILIGGFGVHRFYLGYTTIGILYLAAVFIGIFTCGITSALAGIAGLIEGIVILTGGMKDAEGHELLP